MYQLAKHGNEGWSLASMCLILSMHFTLKQQLFTNCGYHFIKLEFLCSTISSVIVLCTFNSVGMHLHSCTSLQNISITQLTFLYAYNHTVLCGQHFSKLVFIWLVIFAMLGI